MILSMIFWSIAAAPFLPERRGSTQPAASRNDDSHLESACTALNVAQPRQPLVGPPRTLSTVTTESLYCAPYSA